MFSFKRTYKTTHMHQSPTPGLLQKVHALLLQWAVYLQQQASKLSVRKLRFFLFLFCLLSSCICSWIILISFRQKEESELKVTPIRLPLQVLKTGNENLDTDYSTGNKWQQVQTWHHVLDSLHSSTLYNRFRSSFNSQLDSLHHVETRNKLQQRNKLK